MNGTKIVFDTCAVILLLKGKLELSSLSIDIDKALQYISVITKMELMAKSDIKPEEERAISRFIADVTVSPLDEAVERKAVEIRRTTKIKLPDCIIAATAVALEAILITNDPHLLRLSLPGYKVKQLTNEKLEMSLYQI
jgi:predicted nucleic acid-binding protein